MKNMKRQLQFRFVLLSSIALLMMQMLIDTFCIFRNYRQITDKSDHIIMSIRTEPESSEAEGSRYFIVTYELHSKSFSADLNHTTLVTRQLAAEYARKALDSKKDTDYLDSYRYSIQREPDSLNIVFLARSAPLESFRSYTKTLILISVGGIFVMILILIIFSGRIVAPLVRNHQKQKEFITSASHELKTPLTVINADAQILETEIGENEWLSDIMLQTKRMTEMTHKLVYLAKSEERNDFFVKIDFPISDMTQELVQSYQAVAKNQNKVYQSHIQNGISYCGDEKAIRELITVLLDNAFKYSTAHGTIVVRLDSEKFGVRFTVENTVSNIELTQVKKFTERFYRADTSDKISGFGIGLSIAQAVTEAHHGKLTVTLADQNTIRISAFLKK